VAVDGTKMRAVASPKNIAGAERLARDVAHTEKEIAYYLDRLDIIDETVAQGFDDQPLHRENFSAAIASLKRRKDRLVRRQQELERRDEKVLVFGEPEAKPMGYGLAPKMPSYNLQSVSRRGERADCSSRRLQRCQRQSHAAPRVRGGKKGAGGRPDPGPDGRRVLQC
jgi:transposase